MGKYICYFVCGEFLQGGGDTREISLDRYRFLTEVNGCKSSSHVVLPRAKWLPIRIFVDVEAFQCGERREGKNKRQTCEMAVANLTLCRRL